MLSTRFAKKQFISKTFLSEPVFHLERRRKREANLEFSPTNAITFSQWLDYYGYKPSNSELRLPVIIFRIYCWPEEQE